MTNEKEDVSRNRAGEGAPGSSIHAEIAFLLRLFFCEHCFDEHGRNPQSVSCYCDCHDSTRDYDRWPLVREHVLKGLDDWRRR